FTVPPAPRVLSAHLPPLSHFSLHGSAHHRHQHSFPTRRSSDLKVTNQQGITKIGNRNNLLRAKFRVGISPGSNRFDVLCRNIIKDRKSTRLNSSHVSISYAVFCLKKKTRDSLGRALCTFFSARD